MKPKILAITGSQRKNGNSYLLAEAILKSTSCKTTIIQLSDKKINHCTVCGECVNKDCILDDDLHEIMEKMSEADGIIFVIPKYLLAPSIFTAFLERLATITHMRKHEGYGGGVVNPEYSLYQGLKPFCVFALSGRGEFNEELLTHIVRHTEYLGLKLVKHGSPPYIAVNILAGDNKGEVLNNKEAISQCKALCEKLITTLHKKK